MVFFKVYVIYLKGGSYHVSMMTSFYIQAILGKGESNLGLRVQD